MAHVSFQTIGTKFIMTGADGNPINNTMYSSMRTARQAATKLGHTYTSDTPKVEAPAPKPKAKVSEAMQADLDSAQVLKVRDLALAAAGYKSGMSSDEVKDCDWKAATKVAQENGFQSYYSLKATAKKVRNGIWFKNQTPEKQAELRAKSEARKSNKVERRAKIAKPKAAKRKQVPAPVIVPTPEPMAPIASDLSEAERQLQNAICKVNGFPRFRECQYAASHPDHSRHGEALIVMAILAATMKAAKPNRSQLEKPFAKFG